MTPVERLQAAIEKLETAKRDEKWGPAFGDGFLAIQAQDSDDHWRWVSNELAPDDARLIVTLHRTIDAQLAILHFAVDGRYEPEFLALADAILGHSPAPALSDRELAEVARFGIHPELGEGC